MAFAASAMLIQLHTATAFLVAIGTASANPSTERDLLVETVCRCRLTSRVCPNARVNAETSSRFALTDDLTKKRDTTKLLDLCSNCGTAGKLVVRGIRAEFGHAL